MKLFVSAIIIIFALLANAQISNVPVKATTAVDEEETEQATNALTSAVKVPAPVKDPAKCVIAHFGFDGNLQPDVGGGATIPVTFKRESAAYLEGEAVNENSPRFVEGRFSRAVLLESAYANLFSIGQASAADATAFYSLQGTTLSISSDPGFATQASPKATPRREGYAEASRPWQGKEALAVATKGENSEEGFSVESSVEKALYTKESAPAIAPAFYLASLYLKGQGNVKLTLKDVESGVCGEPVYVELSDNWQRFSCMFGYSFNGINIGANHEADWKNSIPPGTAIGAKLQLICATVDSQKLNFFADGLQLEKRLAVSGKAELSPHSWVLGAFQTVQEQLAIDVKNDYFNTWKKNGSIAFWFKPLWEARDGSGELILQIAKNQLNLSHNSKKIIFSPAGVSFTPYDWKNNWHHIVMAWNEAGERTLYVDGMDYPNTSGETRPIKDPEAIMAGDFVKNLSPNGALDDLTLYNITLNSEQVKVLAAIEPKPEPAQSTESASAPAATAAPAASIPAAPSSNQVAQEETEEE